MGKHTAKLGGGVGRGYLRFSSACMCCCPNYSPAKDDLNASCGSAKLFSSCARAFKVSTFLTNMQHHLYLPPTMKTISLLPSTNLSRSTASPPPSFLQIPASSSLPTTRLAPPDSDHCLYLHLEEGTPHLKAQPVGALQF